MDNKITTQEKWALAKAQYDDYVKRGLDPNEMADIFRKCQNQSATDKHKGITIHNGTEILGKPAVRRVFDGIATGLEELDKNFILGLKPGDLVAFAGGSSLGKSSVTMFMAMNMSRAGVPVITYNFEDSDYEYSSRFQLLAKGNGFTTKDLKNFYYYELNDMLPFFKEPLELINGIRFASMAVGAKVFIVDMINDLVKINSNDDADNLIQSLRNIAAELGIIIIFTAKLRKPAGLSQNARTTEHFCPRGEAIAGFNSIEFLATKIFTISHIPDGTGGLNYIEQHNPFDPTQKPFAIHVAKNRAGKTTIDYNKACLCQWLFYNDRTVLDCKGVQDYAV